MTGRLIGILAVTVMLLPGARAATILDTFPASGNLWKPIEIAVPFTNASLTEPVITSVRAAVRGSTAPVQIGIMTDQNGLPSDSFLFSQIVSPSLSSDLVLTGLHWLASPSVPLWLTVIEPPEFSSGSGFWQGNAQLDQPWAFKATMDEPWNGFAQQTPAARIITAQIPEPASVVLLAGGVFGLLTLTARKRLRDGSN